MAFRTNAQQPGTLRWSYASKGEIYSSPAIDIEGTLYIGVNDNTDDAVNDNSVIALNTDGTLKWEAPLGDWVDSTPALSPDGVLYVGCWDGFLYALDMETGQELWKYESLGVIEGSPAIGEDGTVYFGNGLNSLYAIKSDGSLRWQTDNTILNGVFQDWVDASPTIDADGNIWAADLWGIVAKLAPNGNVLWKVDLGYGIPASPAIAKDGTVYFGDDDGFVIALTPGVDQPKWAFETGLESILSSPIIGPDGTIYVGTGSDELYAFIFDSQNNEVLVKSGWPFTGAADVIYSTPAIADNGTVYVGSGDTNLYAVNGSGQKLWEFKTGGFVDSSPAIGPDGTVYVGSTDGKVYAIYGDGPLSYASRWPKYRGSLEANGKVDPYRAWVEENALLEANPFSDPDEDEIENVFEWAFISDPLVADPNQVILPLISNGPQDLSVQAEWRAGISGILFQYSDSLAEWITLNLDTAQSLDWVDAVVIEDLGEKMRAIVQLNPANSPPRFFRLTGIRH